MHTVPLHITALQKLEQIQQSQFFKVPAFYEQELAPFANFRRLRFTSQICQNETMSSTSSPVVSSETVKDTPKVVYFMKYHQVCIVFLV